MADLKQALIWLSEGKKVCHDNSVYKFLHLQCDKIVDERGFLRYIENSLQDWKEYIVNNHHCEKDEWACRRDSNDQLFIKPIKPSGIFLNVRFCPFCGDE